MTDFNDLLMPLIQLEQARQPIMLSRLPGPAFLRRIVFEFQKNQNNSTILYS
jgi:hypothetical protein